MTMTFIQIAELAGCGIRTVQRTAHKLWPEKSFYGKADLDEAMAKELMNSLPKRNMVRESGQMTGQVSGQMTGRLPSGAQLKEIRILAMANKIDRTDLRQLLGLPEVKISIVLPEPIATPADATLKLGTALKLLGGQA